MGWLCICDMKGDRCGWVFGGREGVFDISVS